MTSKLVSCLSRIAVSFLLLLVVFLVSTVHVNAVDAGSFSGGDGTQTNPYKITKYEDLIKINQFPSSHYILESDISLRNIEWTSICSSTKQPFTGKFDGNGHHIIGADSGIFGLNKGIITNLTTTGGKISKYVKELGFNIGAIALYNEGEITNCNNESSISFSLNNSCDMFAGGIAGSNAGRIFHSSNIGALDSSSSAYAGYNGAERINVHMGGIAGRNTGANPIVDTCYNVGDFSAYASGQVAQPTATAYAHTYVGGLVGLGENVKMSYNAGLFNMQYYGHGIAYAQGIIGEKYFNDGGNITDCYSVKTDGTDRSALADESFFPSFDFNTTWIISRDKEYNSPIFKSNTLSPTSIDKISIKELPDYTYTSSVIKPQPEIAYLIKNKDYCLSYKNNLNKGYATLIIDGIGNYTGRIVKQFEIKAKPIGELNIGQIKSQEYSGVAIKPVIQLYHGNKLLKVNNDYNIKYSNNVVSGRGLVTIIGKGNYSGSITRTFVINSRNIAACQFSNISSQSYNGKRIMPNLIIKYHSMILKKGKDYILSYGSNKNTGFGTITVKGIGNYRGDKQVRFQIVPQKISALSVTSNKKQMSIKWKKDSKASGYQITYAENKSFSIGKKNVTISNNKIVKKTIKKLKQKKYYYVKVRAYKRSGNEKLFGAYSRVKKVKIR